MSRNFELMQQIEDDVLLRARSGQSSPFTNPAALIRENERAPWADNEISTLVQKIFLMQTGDAPRVVVFAGIDHGDGCSRIAASVADSLARTSRRPVCLVEANFRSPALPDFFGTTNHFGLADALLAENPIRSYGRAVGTDKLWLLSSGGLVGDSANLLNSEGIKTRMAELRAEFDFVILDAPPLSRYADAIAIGGLTDGLVLVLEAESTKREAAQAVTTSLRLAKVPILGAVLNKRVYPIPEGIYRRL